MIEKTIAKIEAKLEGVGSVDDERKGELLNLLSTLRSEVTELSKTQNEHAESITRFTELSTHEAMREEKSPHLLDLSLEGLSKSVDGFEGSHPKLVEIVNSICVMLSNIGI